MALPIRTTLDDVRDVCGYLAKKPTGATPREAKAVLDPKRLDGRKISALKLWGLIEEGDDGRLKLTAEGRNYARGDANAQMTVLGKAVRRIRPYAAIIERAHHRQETSISSTDVAARWHEHFSGEVANTDATLKNQAVCFFQLAQGAGLGDLIVGRKGAQTRFEFDRARVAAFVREDGAESPNDAEGAQIGQTSAVQRSAPETPEAETGAPRLGQGIFIAHGKNRKPLEQLKRIFDQFKVPHKVAVDEPHLGRPISQKVRETMQSCSCAILIFTADEQFQDKNGEAIWRPSENVIYELGAAGYLYESRIVIMKEEGVSFPTNFNDLGYISFSKDQLEAKAMDVLKELIGFGIVKVST